MERPFCVLGRRFTKTLATLATLLLLTADSALAQPAEVGGEATLKLPDLSQVSFLGMNGHRLLMIGLLFCVFGLGFGLVIYMRLKNLPVHRSMREISELIYETCKTYLITQGKFLMLLWVFIAVIIVLYFGVLRHFEMSPSGHHPGCSAWSESPAATAWRGSAFGSTPSPIRARRSPLCGASRIPVYQIPLEAGMSIGMMLISVELLIMLFILLFVPGDYAGPCFIGFAIGESLGAAALRIAGGIFTKIADIGSDLMKIVFKIKEDDARNPGVIADCTGDNAGDSVGPTADGFETYGVTGVALITFILLGVKDPDRPGAVAGVDLRHARHDAGCQRARLFHQRRRSPRPGIGNADKMNFEVAADLAGVAHFDRFDHCHLRHFVLHHPRPGRRSTLWWKLATIISCGTLAGALIPELVKVFTSTESRHVREVVTSAKEGGASLGILSGFVAGNFSAYYLGLAMVALMSIAYCVSTRWAWARSLP